MIENIIAKLTAKDDKYACAFADKIISESQETDEWYEYFDDFASLLNHPKSFVRNRVLYILAANAQWDEENRFDLIISDFLAHITDEKPITARQCIKALAQIGSAKPQSVPVILSCLRNADLSKYKDSMRPLIEKDIAETEKRLTMYFPRLWGDFIFWVKSPLDKCFLVTKGGECEPAPLNPGRRGPGAGRRAPAPLP